MRCIGWIILALLPLAGCSPKEHASADGKADSVSIADIAINYARLTPMTKEPIPVSPLFASSCVSFPGASEKSGPHTNTAIMIYMNASAAATFKNGGVYPVNSVIVKEKKPIPNTIPNPTSNPADGEFTGAVGGMIKRASGFDPAHGDWEYFYFPAGGKIDRGAITSCVQCHAGAAGKDHVFGDWAPMP